MQQISFWIKNTRIIFLSNKLSQNGSFPWFNNYKETYISSHSVLQYSLIPVKNVKCSDIYQNWVRVYIIWRHIAVLLHSETKGCTHLGPCQSVFVFSPSILNANFCDCISYNCISILPPPLTPCLRWDYACGNLQTCECTQSQCTHTAWWSRAL